MPNRKQNCQTINQLATPFNLESQKISLTRQLSVDPAAARDSVCLFVCALLKYWLVWSHKSVSNKTPSVVDATDGLIIEKTYFYAYRK